MKNERDIPAAADLILMIQFAFDSVRLEDGISWHQADAIDEYRDGIAERAMDDYEHWKDMPDEDLDDGSSAPGFLDAKGLRFYLPAYMLAVLRGRRFQYATANGFLWRLRDPRTVAELESLLTDKQRASIANFLATVADRQEWAREALPLWEQD